MISASDFSSRFAALVTGGIGPGLPRREKDRHILLKAAVLSLRVNLPCSELSLRLALKNWLAMLGPRVDIDHVSLRRALVDFQYLHRDVAGLSYRATESDGDLFAPEVEGLLPGEIVIRARRQILNQAEERARSTVGGKQP